MKSPVDLHIVSPPAHKLIVILIFWSRIVVLSACVDSITKPDQSIIIIWHCKFVYVYRYVCVCVRARTCVCVCVY